MHTTPTRRRARAALASAVLAALAAAPLVATSAQAAVTLPTTFLDSSSTWSYSDDGTDPAAGSADRLVWTEDGFDDSAWKHAAGPFGAKGGKATGLGASFPVSTLLTQYLAGGTTDVPTFHFRSSFSITADQLSHVRALTASMTYDDAVQVFVNGVKVAGFVDDRVEAADESSRNLMYAGNSGGDPVSSTFTIPASALRAGANEVAVALYQDRATSSDIYFDLKSLAPVQSAAVSDVVLTVGDDESSRNLAWYTDLDVAQVAQVARKDDVVDGVFPADKTVTVPSSGAVTTSGAYNHFASLTDLQPDTQYVYRVGDVTDGWSPTYGFRTQAFDGDFGFLFFGDPQIGASGNVANDQAGWQDTLDVAQATYPDSELLFSAGDQVNTASNEAQYDAFLAPDQLREIPLVATNGNHDVGSKAYNQHYNLPNVDLTSGAGSATSAGGDYWFRYKDVLFMDINSNSSDIASHQAFLEKVVAEQGADVTWKVLAFHHSIYSVAAHANDSDIVNLRNNLPQIISDLGIDLVLQGHDHVYTRSYLVNDGKLADASEVAGQRTVEAGEGDVLYVTANSASGSKYYDVTTPNAWYASVLNQEKVRNYSQVQVTDASITVRTMRSQANGADEPVNSVVDEVTLERKDVVAPTLDVPATTSITVDSAFDPLAGVTAADDRDGDLTAKVQVSGTVDPTTVGTYPLRYEVADAAGNVATAHRVVTVTTGTLTTRPVTVTGTPKVGSTLTASSAAWSPSAVLSYQWFADGTKVAGATKATLALPASLAGKRVTVVVTGTRTGYSTASVTSAAKLVAAGTLVASKVAVSGTAKVGQTLRASAGTWSPRATLSYQWLANGSRISGATAATLTLPAAVAGKRVTVVVTGKLAGYTTTSVTSAARTVAKGTIASGKVAVSGTAKVGRTLHAKAGTWSPRPTLSYQWYANGKKISGATKSTLKVSSSLVGKRLTVKVTGKKAGYTTVSRTSAKTAKVARR